MNQSSKDNPNPIVHSTVGKKQHRQPSGDYCGASSIQILNLDVQTSAFDAKQLDGEGAESFDEGAAQISSSPAIQRSLALALSAAAYPAGGSKQSAKLGILEAAGFALHSPTNIEKHCSSLRRPSYRPQCQSTASRAKSDDSGKETTRRDKITDNEVFDIIRNIQDPEHPLTLEQLNVVRLELVEVADLAGCEDDVSNDVGNANGGGRKRRRFSTVNVQFTPTIPHCSMATLIGLSLRVKLFRSLPPRFKVIVQIEPGTHVSEHAVNKQLADKERVRAALENEHLLGVVNRCISGGMQLQ
ncbi:hypothetical protein THAOC_35789 [Thalassiosira oceanica]|uniref:Uncharacterized protein n=1 Tax=Thalassiosira oceanica TaxID=159749 RepID=K0R177_THAOC|nr:hypothetical protein THAOC_35789 [Thalassiosira oceanica]|mmetsp:Transcript_8944/g.20803  ORF Transcript_8944/g.20803 Transcript_8944/m.20803 type:complete len:300 (+) Transcript_8944:319-1218(+)|eukprot:EJK45590.1 hypothetical protein THAOC_35789 [Thalassiosira oceanica]